MNVIKAVKAVKMFLFYMTNPDNADRIVVPGRS